MVKCDTHQRSLAKTISWRFLASLTTFILVFIFTGELVIALEVGAVEVIAKLIIFFFHERAWDHISWGKVAVESE